MRYQCNIKAVSKLAQGGINLDKSPAAKPRSLSAKGIRAAQALPCCMGLRLHHFYWGMVGIDGAWFAGDVCRIELGSLYNDREPPPYPFRLPRDGC